jgi:hypothetical protein
VIQDPKHFMKLLQLQQALNTNLIGTDASESSTGSAKVAARDLSPRSKRVLERRVRGEGGGPEPRRLDVDEIWPRRHRRRSGADGFDEESHRNGWRRHAGRSGGLLPSLLG